MSWMRAIGVVVCFLSLSGLAQASVRDAHLSGLFCTACHTQGSQLTDIGRAWMASSNRLMPIGRKPLLELRATAAYVGDAPANGLPKLVVDYLDALATGTIAPNLSFALDQRVVDGGEPSYLREAFVQFRRPRSRYVFGAIDEPLPIDPDRFRELHADYATIDAQVGANPFSLKDTHPMVAAFSGDPFRGSEFGAALAAGHEVGSGVPQTSADALFSFTQRSNGLTFGALRYDGTRMLGVHGDRFSRNVVTAVADRGPLRLDALYERGFDGDPGTGHAAGSSGGMVQFRDDLRDGAFVMLRYEGVADSLGTFTRVTDLGGGWSLGRHLRVTLEDEYGRASGQTHHTLHFVLIEGLSNARVAGAAY